MNQPTWRSTHITERLSDERHDILDVVPRRTVFTEDPQGGSVYSILNKRIMRYSVKIKLNKVSIELAQGQASMTMVQ